MCFFVTLFSDFCFCSFRTRPLLYNCKRSALPRIHRICRGTDVENLSARLKELLTLQLVQRTSTWISPRWIYHSTLERMSDSTGGVQGSIWVETGLISLIRFGYFLACRQYVNVSLFSDLRSVIREDGGSGALESPDEESIELGETGTGYFPGSTSVGSSNGNGKHQGSALPLPVTAKKAGKGEGGAGRKGDESSTSRRAHLYAKLSTALFCLSFSESCTLFTLLLFGEAVSEQ